MLQNFFGIALRSGATSVSELRNKLLASFFHLASSADSEYHTVQRQRIVGAYFKRIVLMVPIHTNLEKVLILML